MAVFKTAEDAERFQHNYCARCVHSGPEDKICAVWSVQMGCGGDPNPEHIPNRLITTVRQHHTCLMYVPDMGDNHGQ